MKIEEKFNYIDLERVTDETTGTRYYVTPKNDKFYSVTTILSETADKSGLEAWKEYVGITEANRVVNEACNLGTLMHENLENYILGNEMKKGGNLIRQMARNMANVIIENGLSKVEKVYGIEKMLYSELGYAGTADLIIEYNGQIAIGDFKTARKMKTEKQILDYYCQIAAYAIAHDELHGTDIKHGVIFMADRDNNFKEFYISEKDLTKYKEIWLNRLEQFLERQESKNEI